MLTNVRKRQSQSYILTQFIQEDASIAERIRSGTTAEPEVRQRREDALCKKLEDLSRRLMDDLPVNIARDKMMRELEKLERRIESG